MQVMSWGCSSWLALQVHSVHLLQQPQPPPARPLLLLLLLLQAALLLMRWAAVKMRLMARRC